MMHSSVWQDSLAHMLILTILYGLPMDDKDTSLSESQSEVSHARAADLRQH